jgi:hypothetical protein
MSGDLVKLLVFGLQFLFRWSLLLVWIAWWLWGVNWKQAWQVLAEGAWVPLLLLMFAAALVWSQIDPSTCPWLGVVTVRNFWWQFGAVSLLAALALFCGWLQGVFGWTPAGLDLEPSQAASADHGHGHH